MVTGIYQMEKRRGLFKKGSTPWNKGKSGYLIHSEEYKKKLSKDKSGKKIYEMTDEIMVKFKKPKSLITKEKMSQSKLKLYKNKKNHPRYLKDRSKLKISENKMDDTQYKYWRKEIRKRDRNICRLLNSECKGRLETHHIYDWENYPELRYVIKYGITLCAFHHPRGREEEKRMIPVFLESLSVSKE